MARTFLDYQITSEEIANEFVKLGIVIPLSFVIGGGLIFYYGKPSSALPNFCWERPHVKITDQSADQFSTHAGSLERVVNG